jgi:hypothetical protein
VMPLSSQSSKFEPELAASGVYAVQDHQSAMAIGPVSSTTAC